MDLTHKENIPQLMSDDNWMVVGETVLKRDDETDLISGEWLNDRDINAAQQILQQQHPDISGFQSPILQFTRTFEVQKKKFVQILHANSNHWITISTIQCPPSPVKVYDTNHERLNSQMKSTIADLLQTDQNFIVVEYINVQKQKGSDDCGLLAIAIATALCCEEKPELLQIDQAKSREHLRLAFEQKLLTQFPSQSVCREEPYLGWDKIKVYCYCRQIDDGRRMIRCDGCEDWFHVNCAKISPERLKKIKSSVWLCKSCYKDRPFCKKTVDLYTHDRVTKEIKEIEVKFIAQ